MTTPPPTVDEAEVAEAVFSESSQKVKEAVDSIDATLATTQINMASIRETIEAIDNFQARWNDVTKKFGEVLALSLGSALGIEAPCSLSEQEKTSVLGGKPTFDELCRRLKEGCYKKVIVMAGAGISVSAGIPDFRSPGSGLYETLDLDKFQLPSAQAVFDIEFFRSNPKPFFMLSKELFYAQAYKPTPAHYFIKLLSNKGLLLRCYTQNIDSLERKAGISKDLIVESHGTFEDATCTNPDCKKKFSAAQMKMVEATVKADKIPTCDSCSIGVIKPDVVFFGENLPDRFKELLETDFQQCDLLVVMGTSLQVQPFCSLVCRVKQTTPRLLINKERVGNFVLESEGGYRDVAMLEECDKAVRTICKQCNWSQDLDQLLKQHSGRQATAVVSDTKRKSRPAPNQTSSSTSVKPHATKDSSRHTTTTARTKTAFESTYTPKKSPRK